MLYGDPAAECAGPRAAGDPPAGHFPGTEELARGLTGTAPAVTSAKAERLLGHRPSHAWRDYL